MAELFATFGIDWRLLLVQAVNFGVLLLALWWFLYRPVLAMITERQKVIEKGVQDASDAEKALREAADHGQEIRNEATKNADDILAQARERAEERGAEIVSAAQAKAEAELRDAREKAAEAQAQALKESERDIARAAVLAAEKVLRDK